jgi:hypothetical protein
MTTLSQHQQFSHTTRSYDLTRPVDENLKAKINRIIDANKDNFQYIFVIEDKDLIEKIYQISDVPDETSIGIPYLPRKNSQLLAPLLLLLVPHGDDQYSSYMAGKTYGHIGLTAINAGYHTSFCICYDRDKAKTIFADKIAPQHWLPLGAIFMGVGYIAPGTTAQTDLRQNLVTASAYKANKDYIKVLG